MFAQLEGRTSRGKWSPALCVALHGVLLFLLVRAPKPMFISPSSVAWGQHGTSTTTLVYLSQYGPEDRQTASAAERAPLTAPLRKAHPRRKPPATAPAADKTAEAAMAAPRAGSPFGSLLTGPVDGHDVRPALPVVFPDPVVYPWQIPSGVQGNVIVEITIDESGIVTDMKLLQGLGYGIDEKVMATLRSWRFTPARFDGRAIASQQDVHFRFPS